MYLSLSIYIYDIDACVCVYVYIHIYIGRHPGRARQPLLHPLRRRGGRGEGRARAGQAQRRLPLQDIL